MLKKVDKKIWDKFMKKENVEINKSMDSLYEENP
jgi:hypothetical protein